MDENGWLIDLSDRVVPRSWEEPFAELSEPERVFVAIWTLEADVNNGGFDQYYGNSSGDHAWFAPDALRAIGAATMAGIVERANAPFGPEGPPVSREERLARLEAVEDGAEEVWGELEEAFYDYPDDLTGLLYRFVQANKGEIRDAT